MSLPPLLQLKSESEYRDHWRHEYVTCGPVTTADNIPVYFSVDRFNHTFYESDRKSSRKLPTISQVRVERMDWIKLTLQQSNAELFWGWDKHNRKHSPDRRFAVFYQEFVVVILITKNAATGMVKGKFVTAYLADKNIAQIRRSPKWSLADFEDYLQKSSKPTA